jgi:hypothetical protein
MFFQGERYTGKATAFWSRKQCLQGEIIAPEFLYGSHLHCCSNILGLATKLQIDLKEVMFTVCD